MYLISSSVHEIPAMKFTMLLVRGIKLWNSVEFFFQANVETECTDFCINLIM